MSTAALASQRVRLDLIDLGENVRELDEAHVDALASSIEQRGLIAPLAVRRVDERFWSARLTPTPSRGRSSGPACKGGVR